MFAGTEGIFETDLYTYFRIRRLQEGSTTELAPYWEGKPTRSFAHPTPEAPDGIDADGWQTIATRQTDSVASVVASVIGLLSEPHCTGANLRAVLEIAIALRESARSGGRPVTLPIADRGLQIVPVPVRYSLNCDIWNNQ